MSRKRRNTSSPEPDSPSDPNSPPSQDDAQDEWDDSDEEEVKEAPRVNEYTGQVGAFPGLTSDGDELFYGPASDGIDYLRMVRSEAKAVPYILTAPTEQTREARNGNGLLLHAEDGGYFHDGAYTAIGSLSPGESEPLSSAQQRYYDTLLSQFRLVQATMRCVPPLSAIQSLAPSQLISLPQGSRKARTQWEAHIVRQDPHPVQIACMDSGTVLELVKLLQRRLSVFLQHKNEGVIRRIGAWTWAVLGRCPDRGELSSEDIGELRQLAQEAVKVHQKGMAGINGITSDDDEDSEVSSQGQPVEQQDPGQDVGDVQEGRESVGEQEARSAGVEMVADVELEESARDRLIKVTVDMIITVVGEMYGQRDLLQLRPRWKDESG